MTGERVVVLAPWGHAEAWTDGGGWAGSRVRLEPAPAGAKIVEADDFSLPPGTDFQRRVWGALLAIPEGETRTYGQIAESIGSPGAARAVGSACGANPCPGVVPCHRALGAAGLGGWSGSGGLEEKARMIEAEGAR